MILRHLLKKYTNSAIERYFRCNDEYGVYLGNAMAESGLFSMFIDQPKTLSGEGGGSRSSGH